MGARTKMFGLYFCSGYDSTIPSVSKKIHFRLLLLNMCCRNMENSLKYSNFYQVAPGLSLKSDLWFNIPLFSQFLIFFYITLPSVTMVTESNSLSSYTCCVKSYRRTIDLPVPNACKQTCFRRVSCSVEVSSFTHNTKSKKSLSTTYNIFKWQ